VLVASLFFFFANLTKLIGVEVGNYFTPSHSLAIMSSTVWVGMFLVRLATMNNFISSTGAIEIATEEHLEGRKQNDEGEQ
jgi:hypothetical protein